MNRQAIEVIETTRNVTRGIVERADEEALLVRTAAGRLLLCDVLRPPDGAPGTLAIGDPVLVALPLEGETRGCVLGVIESFARALAPQETRTITAETIVLEAGSRIEIRVGDSGVLVTEDGRVQIRGKNVSSRARGLHTIRGAAVRIN